MIRRERGGKSDEVKLRESEARFRATFEQAAVGLAHVALNGALQLVNEKFCSICGYSREELLRLSFQDITFRDDLGPDMDLVARMLTGEIQTYSLEKRYVRKDRSLVWVNLTVSLVRNEDRSPAYFISAIEDITQRKATEAELDRLRMSLAREVRERTAELTEMNLWLKLQISERDRLKSEFDRLFILSPGLLAIADKGRRFVRANPALCGLLGYDESELTSRPILDFVFADDRNAMLEAEELLLRGRILRNFENRCLARDGSLKWVSWTAVTVGNDSTTYWVGLDITDSKTAQRVIAAQKEQIAASSKMDSLGRLAAGIAHEINNPLTIVYGQTCVLRDRIARNGVDAAEAVRGLDNIEKMTKRIVDIISGLRMFARDGSEDSFEFCSLNEVVESTLTLCAGQLRASNVEFIYERPKSDDRVRCRPVQISQVLLNLINNAHDAVLARSSSRRIRLEIVPEREAIEILVYDNGPGVSPQVRANLFQPFFTTKPLGKGTGLGLSIARGIVGDHGGEISFRPGTETCFVIRLPRSATTGSA